MNTYKILNRIIYIKFQKKKNKNCKLDLIMKHPKKFIIEQLLDNFFMSILQSGIDRQDKVKEVMNLVIGLFQKV
jgi:hypothetical protein